MPELLNTSEVLARYPIFSSQKCVRSFAVQGMLPYYRIHHGHFYFFDSDVERFLENFRHERGEAGNQSPLQSTKPIVTVVKTIQHHQIENLI